MQYIGIMLRECPSPFEMPDNNINLAMSIMSVLLCSKGPKCS